MKRMSPTLSSHSPHQPTPPYGVSRMTSLPLRRAVSVDVPRTSITVAFDGFSNDRQQVAQVAALSSEEIASLNRAELIAVIRGIRENHLRPGVREQLPMLDTATLRRLVELTRRLCRQQQSSKQESESEPLLTCG